MLAVDSLFQDIRLDSSVCQGTECIADFTCPTSPHKICLASTAGNFIVFLGRD